MPDLSAGTTVLAQDTPPSVTDSEVSFLTTTSTSYTAAAGGGTSADCAVTFVAPTTGRVLLLYAATLDNSGANSTYATPEVRTGSSIGGGAVTLAASDDNAVRAEGTSAIRYGVHHMLSGLTAGADYNARLLHRVTAGTGTLDERTITVVPVP